MTELRIWGGFYFRPDVQQLSIGARLHLLDIAVTIADCENRNVPAGFLPESAMPFLPIVGEVADEYVNELLEAEFVVRMDDPAGLLLPGWTEKVRRFKPGVADDMKPCWGQTSLETVLDRRARNAKSQAKKRSPKSPPHPL